MFLEGQDDIIFKINFLNDERFFKIRRISIEDCVSFNFFVCEFQLVLSNVRRYFLVFVGQKN